MNEISEFLNTILANYFGVVYLMAVEMLCFDKVSSKKLLLQQEHLRPTG